MKIRNLLLVGLLGLNGSISAQELLCPQTGIPMSRDPGCVIPNNSNASPPQQLPENSLPPRPAGYWQRTWGAIATDNVKGILGAVVGESDKQAAQDAAMSDCKSKGGEQCRSIFAYFNQCAVMIVGQKWLDVQGAVSISEATQLGMKRCKKEDNNCRVYFSNCSKPKFFSF